MTPYVNDNVGNGWPCDPGGDPTRSWASAATFHLASVMFPNRSVRLFVMSADVGCSASILRTY